MEAGEGREAALRYEGWVLRAFDVDPADLAREGAWVARFRALSQAFLGIEAHGGSTGLNAPAEREDHFLRALVYGQRTFLWTLRWARAWPDRPASIQDLGSGLGSAGLALAELGTEVETVDHAGLEAFRQALWKEAGQPHCARVGDLRRETEGRSGVWAYSLREAFPSPEEARGYLRTRWDRGMRQALILEAGSKASARWLQALRDGLHMDSSSVRIEAPCRARGSCPRRQSLEDWCHFTWNVGLGPSASQLLQRAGRDGQRLHGSFLRLGLGEPEPGERVLEVRPKGRVAWVQVCTPEGEASWEFQKRDRKLYQSATALRPGERVTVRGPSSSKGGRRRWGADATLVPNPPVDEL